MSDFEPTLTFALSESDGVLRTLAPPLVGAPTLGRAPLPPRYEDLGYLARGGMGELRTVRDRVLGVELAMKLLALRHAKDDSTRALFLAEAKATAQLQHPGIVAVQDFGELEDGRPWFTMTIVRGLTLGGLCEAEEGTRRRRISVLRQVADVLAYAHAAGAVHRDLKPENIMIGPFGEVRVMDWGLATLPGIEHPLDRPGMVVGTPMYMAPEQAAGEATSSATDVWALGAILFQLLSSRYPRSGSAMQVLSANRDGPPPRLPEDPGLPSSLRDLCHACLQRDAGSRPTASTVSEGLAAWLEGLQRRQDALALVAAAEVEHPEIQALEARAQGLRDEAAALLLALDAQEPVSEKEPAWALQDRASALESGAMLKRVTWHQKLRAALTRSPDLPEAHALLADHYREALERAEHARDPLAIARNEVLLRTHDRGQHAAFLQGDGTLSLHTTAPAEARLYRFVERKRRLEPVFERVLGTTPLLELPLQKGSWLVTLDRPGCPTVHYPVNIERAQHWDGVPPGSSTPESIWMPGPGDLGEDDRYVPAGWCIIGGDPEAVDPLARQRVWIDGFIMKRVPVTFGQYVAWMQGLLDAGEEIAELLPIRRTQEPVSVVRDGRIEGHGPWSARHPVVCITHQAAAAYAHAKGWALPHELELEKAGRSVDGRLRPWGDMVEAQWSRVIGSSPSPADLASVDRAYPDGSVYGIEGLAGNVRTWCRTRYLAASSIVNHRMVEGPPDGDLFVVKGAGWHSPARLQGLATRFADRPTARFDTVGMRLVRPISGRS